MIYYLNYDGTRCNVFESQVLTLLILLKNQGQKIRLINFEKAGDLPNQAGHLQKYTHELGEPIISYPKPDHYNFGILPRYIHRLCELLALEKDHQKIILHGRGCFAGYMGVKVKEKMGRDYNVKVVTDFRGLVSEEYKLQFADRNGGARIFSNLVGGYVKRIEKYAARKSDYLFCVSQKFKDYLSGNYRGSAEKITVIPTCINQQRFQFNQDARDRLRTSMGLTENFVVAYCGGIQKWQCPELLFQTFLSIQQRVRNAKLLLITNEKELFKKYAALFRLPRADYSIVTAAYENVSAYLSMADCALLVRKRHPVNEVACPTKFAEYLSCRLPVVASRNIGDLAAMIQTYRVGLFEDELEKFAATIDAIQKADFQRAIDDCYRWDTNIAKILDVYETL